MAALGTVDCPVCGEPLRLKAGKPKIEDGKAMVPIRIDEDGYAHLGTHRVEQAGEAKR